MAHDPMCPLLDKLNERGRCECDLIARIVAREQDLAAERVASCKTHIRRRNTSRRTGWTGRTSWYAVKITTVDQDVAVAAARGGAA